MKPVEGIHPDSYEILGSGRQLERDCPSEYLDLNMRKP
jgi:hypothetical protein